MIEVVAISGGKDSTALALALQEREPDKERRYICTPTGDELPEMLGHWSSLETLLGAKIERIHAKLDLLGLIREFNALPNWRQRWCTRILKIEPCAAYLKGLGEAVLCVGLRADEQDRGGVVYGGLVSERYPLREWGWGLAEVWKYLNKRGVKIPQRTDCARCYAQRLGEWHNLWSDHSTLFDSAERNEETTGHTFRSPSRDTWPAALSGLRQEFEAGRVPRGARGNQCRVCSL